MWDKIKALFDGKKAPAASQDMKHCENCDAQVPADHAHEEPMATQAPMEASDEASDMNNESGM